MELSKRIAKGEKESLRLFRFYENELEYRKAGGILAGVDEVGRGPLAGPVYAACICIPFGLQVPGLNDSKKLKPADRKAAAAILKKEAWFYSYGYASVEEIDRMNILQATLLAMKRAVEASPVRPDLVLVDGNKLPDWDFESRCIIGGDSLMPSIAAASILAKEKRDGIMEIIDGYDPRYNFAQHKGYGTKEHYRNLELYGPSLFHRKSFLKRMTK